jgi:hypothetical protein
LIIFKPIFYSIIMNKNSTFILVFVSLFLLSFSLETKVKNKQRVSNPFRSLRSFRNSQRINLQFLNTRRYRVRLYWVDFDGGLDYLFILGRGESRTIPSFSRHVWVWISENGLYSGYFVSSSQSFQRFVI